MEQITFEATARELVKQLESTLARLSVSADSGLSTYDLEAKAKKIASKLKESGSLLADLPMYKDVEGSDVSWHVSDKLSDTLFYKYASLCKRLGKEALPVSQEKESHDYFAKISDNLFVRISDLPDVTIPAFKVKIEGNTLMAVRADLYAGLPTEIKALIGKEGENNAD